MRRVGSRQTRYLVQTFAWSGQREFIPAERHDAASQSAAIKWAIAHAANEVEVVAPALTGDPVSDDRLKPKLLLAAGTVPYVFQDLTSGAF